jgi:DNA-binding PadR family transcriptional regulator
LAAFCENKKGAKILNSLAFKNALSVCGLSKEAVSSSGEHINFIEIQSEPSLNNPEIIARIKKKVLVSFMEIAIVAELAQRAVMTAPNTIDFFSKSYGISVSPGTVYPVFNSLEKRGVVKRLSRAHGQLYTLTGKGKQEAADLRNSIEIIQDFIGELAIPQSQ